MVMTTYGDISQRTAAWAATEMLKHAEPIVVLSRFGQSKPLPMNKADTVKFRRPIPFAVSTTTLSEGVTPEPKQMRYEDVTVQIGQYGDSVEITDYVNDLSEDPVLKDATVLCGEQAAETIEMVTWGVIKAGTNVFYGASGDSARSDVNDKISTNRQRAVTRYLKAQRAKKVTQMIGASPNYNTTPVDAAFVAFGHTDTEADARDMTNFVPREEYGQMKAMPYEAGKAEDCRYVLSPLLEAFADSGNGTLNGMKSTGGSNVDVYPTIYVGRDSYGLVPLKGAKAITPKVLNPDTPSKSDPLGQRGYVSWKTYYAAVILNQAWLARLEHGVTDL